MYSELKYDSSGTLVKKVEQHKDSKGSWIRTVTDGKGNPIEKEY